MAADQNLDVFLNHPIDSQYQDLRNAIVFAVHDCGFRARSALEAIDAGENRLDKIFRIIGECAYGIHDISRTELNSSGLPRFNMPFELGIFLGCRRYGGRNHRTKACLVLDRERYRYQQFLSDLAGVDIEPHEDDPLVAIGRVRDWLKAASAGPSIDGAQAIRRRYERFHRDLPAILDRAGISHSEMTFFDYAGFVATWLRYNR